MKKTILISILVILGGLIRSNAQMLGIANSNYAGTNGLYMNPSSIADSRYKFYLNLAALDFNVTNSYIRYNAPFSLGNYLLNRVPDQYRDPVTKTVIFKDEYLKPSLDGSPKTFSLGLELRGPSFMIGLGPRSSLALSTRLRTFIQGSNISQNLAEIVRNYIYDQDLVKSANVLTTDNSFAINLNGFSEIGLSFGQTVLNKDEHFIKVGATVKRLAGLYSGYVVNNGINVQVIPNNVPGQAPTIQVPFSANISIGYLNQDFTYLNNPTASKLFNVLTGRDSPGSGMGFDIGMTYEFRPKYDKFIYMMDGVERYDESKNKYKLKVGLAVVDIGRIQYEGSDVYVYNLNNKSNSTIAVKDLENIDSENTSQYFELAAKAFGVNLNDKITTLNMALPTSINTTIDYNIIWKLYVNATWVQSLRPRNVIGMRQNSYISFTPRLEMKWLELAFPLSLFNDYKNFNVGTMLRMGNFFVGSDNIGGVFNIGNLNGLNAYAGLNIPIFKGKIKDRDKDGVSNKRDECRDVPGLWEFRGCPDTDGDGIEDREDACPTLAGLKEFGGCPDSDGDKIPDSKDECPTIAGLAEFGGCPDTDGDKIVDHKDDCPTEAGLLKFNGCPDTDNDGIMNKLDECPNDAGPAEFKGCPDRDGDGLPDKDDKCPDQAGPKEFNGCPDRDKDGVLDMVDQCPDTPGLAQYNGCPDRDMDTVPDQVDKCPDTYGAPENAGCPLVKVVEKVTIIQLAPEEAKVLKEAFDNLEFETGKAIIKEESFPSLGELADLLQKKTSYRLLASGHTDNVGKADTNLKLSKKRAEAIKTYLIERGVDSDQIVTEGFGSKRPIASNKTAKGRQKNRRVELKIIK